MKNEICCVVNTEFALTNNTAQDQKFSLKTQQRMDSASLTRHMIWNNAGKNKLALHCKA